MGKNKYGVLDVLNGRVPNETVTVCHSMFVRHDLDNQNSLLIHFFIFSGLELSSSNA